jgi:hypothetical protein
MFLLHQSQERKRYSKEGERGSERQMTLCWKYDLITSSKLLIILPMGGITLLQNIPKNVTNYNLTYEKAISNTT